MIIKKLLTKKALAIIICLLPILIVYFPWLSFNSVSAGDAAFHFQENLKQLPIIPYTWSNTKIGDFRTLLYPVFYLSSLPSIFSFIPWGVAEKIIWYWPFLLIGGFSSWYLVKFVLPGNKYIFLAPLVYLANTYILMIVGGGQISIALSYALSPLIIAFYLKCAENLNQVSLVRCGLFLALIVGYEPRMAVLSLFVSLLYLVFVNRVPLTSFLKILTFPALLAIGIHFFWFLPSFVARFSVAQTGLSSSAWVEFLSFVDFSDSLSLLHPNWPENIFGMTSFFKPEFLVLPIIVFSSLLFTKYIRTQERIKLVFWLLILLAGAFFAKGAKPPLGSVYLWAFNNLPGMNLFRDSSKFYLLTVTSYTVLLPLFVQSVDEFIKAKSRIVSKDNMRLGLTIIFIVLFGFLSRVAIAGRLAGTFISRKVPPEYLNLQNFLNDDKQFSRIFWLPKKTRFGLMTNIHPAIDADNYISNSICLEPFCSLSLPLENMITDKCFPNERCYPEEFSYLRNPNTQRVFSDYSIKYVIIPSDVDSIYFVKERMKSEEQRQMLVNFVDQVPWLKRVNFDNRITIYENTDHQDLFFIEKSETQKIRWQMINPTKYSVKVNGSGESFKLVFSQNYHSLWKAKVNHKIINSEVYGPGINSFPISGDDISEIIIYFDLQKWVYRGGAISILTIIFCLLSFYKFRKIK